MNCFIPALTEKCNEEENAVLVESEKAKESEVSHLTQKLESTERQKQKIENELESVEEQQKQMEMQLDELEHEKEELEDTTSRVLPSIRFKFSRAFEKISTDSHFKLMNQHCMLPASFLMKNCMNFLASFHLWDFCIILPCFFYLILCRHDLNLYKYLTGIHWQYGCPPNEVKGCILSYVLLMELTSIKC